MSNDPSSSAELTLDDIFVAIKALSTQMDSMAANTDLEQMIRRRELVGNGRTARWSGYTEKRGTASMRAVARVRKKLNAMALELQK